MPNPDTAPNPYVIDEGDLIPAAWLRGRSPAHFYAFNPAVTRYRGVLLLAYRVDFRPATGNPERVACAICRLDANWRVVPESVVALSDTVVGGSGNHYDPRFLTLGDRLFVHYNNSFRTWPNQLHMVELDPDTLEARSPARPLQFDGPRQEIEKNWMFFEHDGDLFAVYQIDPHIVLRVELGEQGPILCRP